MVFADACKTSVQIIADTNKKILKLSQCAGRSTFNFTKVLALQSVSQTYNSTSCIKLGFLNKMITVKNMNAALNPVKQNA